MTERTISTGRGGAGNIRPTQKEDTETSDVNLPHLQTKLVTTGRGGKGNMLENIDPATTRAAQDMDDQGGYERIELAPTRSRTVGRGGYGNNMRAKYSQDSDGKGSDSICEKITSAFN